MSSIVSVSHLCKEYDVGKRDPFRAVDDVSIDVPDGGSIGIVGESGAGKSTIARVIAGLEPPTRGRVEIAGDERSSARGSTRRRRAWARQLQIVFQDPYTSLNPRQTPLECIEEVLGLHAKLGRETKYQRANRLLEQVGLDERARSARPRSLSGGQCQRVAIARAIAAEPRVLVLDEAVSALDVSIQAQVLNLLAEIRSEHRLTYLLISHDLAVVRQLCDDIVVLRSGRVVESGTTGDILDNPRDPYTQRLRESVPGPGWHPRRTREPRGDD